MADLFALLYIYIRLLAVHRAPPMKVQPALRSHELLISAKALVALADLGTKGVALSERVLREQLFLAAELQPKALLCEIWHLHAASHSQGVRRAVAEALEAFLAEEHACGVVTFPVNGLKPRAVVSAGGQRRQLQVSRHELDQHHEG